MANFTIYLADYLSDHNLPECLDLMPDDDSGMTFKDRFIARNIYKEIGAETEELWSMLAENKARECVNRYKWKIEQYLEERDTILDKYVSLSESGESEEGKEESHSDSGSTSENTTGNTHDVGETESESHEDGSTGNTGTIRHNTYYNPVSTTADNIAERTEDVQDTTQTTTDGVTGSTNTENTQDRTEEKTGSTESNGGYNYTLNRKDSRTHQELYRAFKSMPEMIELTNNLEVVYETALSFLDTLFMGVL